MGPPPDVPPVRAFTRVREGPSRRRSSAAMADEAGTRAATAARARIIFFTVFSSDRVVCARRAGPSLRRQSADALGCCGYRVLRVLRFRVLRYVSSVPPGSCWGGSCRWDIERWPDLLLPDSPAALGHR